MSNYTETTVDNTSISYNDDNNLQVNGVVERNKGIVNYDWVGTLAEYQEQDIENQHPEWICYITDDNDFDNDVYEKEEIFIATYGSTTYSEISDAYNAGKICYVEYNKIPIALTKLGSAQARFVGIINKYSLININVTTDNVWDNSVLYFSIMTQDANKVLITDEYGSSTTSPITSTELGHLSGISSNVQTQLDEISKTHLTTNQITNCITEIPQDINLELVDGTLTLKAGSKVYIPNGFDIVGGTSVTYYGWYSSEFGDNTIYTTTETPSVGDKTYSYDGSVMSEDDSVTEVSDGAINGLFYRDSSEDITLTTGNKIPKFDVVTIESDLTYSAPYNGNWIVVYCATDNTIKLAEDGGSGTTTPSGNGFYYNTSTNKIDYYRQTSATGWVCSFPLIKVTSTATQITSIDQIFNGFGYIGSTVFALPGVKGLIPDGRNADETLRNVEFTTSKVATINAFDNYNQAVNLYFAGSLGVYGFEGIFSQTTPPTRAGNNLWYNPETNYWKYTENGGSTWIPIGLTPVAGASTTTTITSFTPKTTFQAVDRNDIAWLSGLGMPSDRYIDLTLGASGSSYTAPANGYVQLAKSGNINQYAQITNGISILNTAPFNGGSVNIWLPIKKGDYFIVTYDLSGATNYFRFYYAEGEN